MRSLLLYRHAKSSWDDWSLEDFDRPLSQRGQKAAPMIGDFLKQQDITPDRILCSPALRTRQTLEQTQIQSTTEQKITFPETLYHAQDMTILQKIRQTDDAYQSLCIIAHNPGLHSLAAHLAQHSNKHEERQKLVKKFPTAALAVFSTNAASWLEVTPQNSTLRHYVTPKRLMKAVQS